MFRIPFMVRIGICLATVLLPLGALDQWFYDHFFQLRGIQNRPSEIEIVTINDSKLYQNFRNFRYDETQSLWFHSFYQKLIDLISSSKPKAIVFTSFYGWIDNNEGVASDTRLIFSSYLNKEDKLVPPVPSLARNSEYGFNNIFSDSDNVVRHSKLFYSSSPSLALKTSQLLSSHTIKRDLLQPFLIDFRGPHRSYPTHDGWEIYENRSTQNFQNKIVLIGRESSPSTDHKTPFGRIPTTEIQANAIETLLQGSDIFVVPRWIRITISALAVGISIVIILLFPLTLAGLFLIFLSLILGLTSLFFFSQMKLWLGVANPLVSILATHLLMLGYKLSRQEEQQWKIQQESEYLRELDQFKNNFISLFSHDLKTPLAKIKAITDRLLTEERTLSDKAADGLQAIDKANTELSRLISDILKVTKMESMSLEPNKDVLDLNRLVEAAVQRLKLLAEEKQISISLDLEPLFSMEGDQQLLQEVILNLVENAIKYSPPQRGITIRTREEDNRVRVSVIDEGEGISSEEIPRVTSKFYRGQSAQTHTKGSGLGLYLAKYFVELHQGRLEISSQLGKGTHVSFWLPIAS